MCTVSFHNFLSEAVLASDSSLNFWCTQDLKLSADTSGSTVYALRSSKPEPCLSLSHPPYSTHTQHSKSILQGAFERDGQYTSCSSHQPLLYCPRFHNSKEKPDCNRSHIPFFFFFFSLSGNILFCQTSTVRSKFYLQLIHYFPLWVFALGEEKEFIHHQVSGQQTDQKPNRKIRSCCNVSMQLERPHSMLG